MTYVLLLQHHFGAYDDLKPIQTKYVYVLVDNGKWIIYSGQSV